MSTIEDIKLKTISACEQGNVETALECLEKSLDGLKEGIMAAVLNNKMVLLNSVYSYLFNKINTHSVHVVMFHQSFCCEVYYAACIGGMIDIARNFRPIEYSNEYTREVAFVTGKFGKAEILPIFKHYRELAPYIKGAVVGGHTSIVEKILENQLDIKLVKSVYSLALTHNRDEIANLILSDSRIDIETAVSLAKSSNRQDFADKLLVSLEAPKLLRNEN